MTWHASIGIVAARAAREEHALGLDGPLECVLTATERAFGVGVAVLDLGGLAGAYLRRPAGEVIFVDAGDPPVRRRFTLAHELGHHRLGHASVVDADLDGTSPDPREYEANAFAAELLVPRPAVRVWAVDRLAGGRLPSLDDVVDLAARFGVSARAALIRLQTAGLLRDAALRRRLSAEIAAGYHLTWLRAAERPDALARTVAPRLPFDRDDSALAAHLHGALDWGGLLRAIGRA